MIVCSAYCHSIYTFTLYLLSVVECELVTVENGNTAMNGTGIGSVVQYSCNLGYELVGNTQQVCLENGTWSIGQGRCECK